MDANTRIKITIGDLLMQLALAQERIEELEKKLEQYEPKEDNVTEFKR
jgi:hypothetical protein